MSAFPIRDILTEQEDDGPSVDSLRIDGAIPPAARHFPPLGCKPAVLPPKGDEPRETFQALTITAMVEIRIPLSPNTDRHSLEADVMDALGAVILPRVPYLTKLQLAHSYECEADFSDGVRTIATDHAGRADSPSTAG